MRKSMYFS